MIVTTGSRAAGRHGCEVYIRIIKKEAEKPKKGVSS
jgi:RNA-splicing ligase RtcB